MPAFESLKMPFGSVRRRHAAITSPTLLALAEDKRPSVVLACVTCPAASWTLDETDLACHCAARRYVSWLPKQKMFILCDDREAAIGELDKPEDG